MLPLVLNARAAMAESFDLAYNNVGILREDHATLASGDVFIGIKTESTDVPETATWPESVVETVRLRGVLDDQ